MLAQRVTIAAKWIQQRLCLSPRETLYQGVFTSISLYLTNLSLLYVGIDTSFWLYI